MAASKTQLFYCGPPRSSRLWTGEAVVGPGEEPCRKLRPIALAEAFLVLTEDFAIAQALLQLKKVLEPRKLGFNTADGAPLYVKVLRS